MIKPDHQENGRTQILAAGVAGFFAGLTRAIVDAILHHITSGT